MSQKRFDFNKSKYAKIVKGIVLVASVASIVTIFYFIKSHTIGNKSLRNPLDIELNNPLDSLNSKSNSSGLSLKNSSDKLKIFYNPTPSGKGVQRIESILKENADRTTPILVKDTIVFSPHSPNGFGNQLEFSDNQPDDQLYFEKEHNTIWYKFIASETGQLTFDIVPVNLNDDYDFMLFKFNGNDFFKKVISKEIKPVRTCISRNNTNLKSMTGLTLDESSESFIHSGIGASYVKYVRVKKGDVFYLLLDNVYNNGNGHSIYFHCKPIKPGELFVGKLIPFERITFQDGDTAFKKGSEIALDSLYLFLITNPGIKIEIQGHVNAIGSTMSVAIIGNPRYDQFQLSKHRAEAIYKVLVKKGIDRNRLTTAGYGSTRKKISVPKNKQECLMNVRAEILILSLDYKNDEEQKKIAKH